MLKLCRNYLNSIDQWTNINIYFIFSLFPFDCHDLRWGSPLPPPTAHPCYTHTNSTPAHTALTLRRARFSRSSLTVVVMTPDMALMWKLSQSLLPAPVCRKAYRTSPFTPASESVACTSYTGRPGGCSYMGQRGEKTWLTQNCTLESVNYTQIISFLFAHMYSIFTFCLILSISNAQQSGIQNMNSININKDRRQERKPKNINQVNMLINQVGINKTVSSPLLCLMSWAKRGVLQSERVFSVFMLEGK